MDEMQTDIVSARVIDLVRLANAAKEATSAEMHALIVEASEAVVWEIREVIYPEPTPDLKLLKFPEVNG